MTARAWPAGLCVEYGFAAVPVESVAGAVSWWEGFRDSHDLGASEMLGDIMLRKDGKPVARISYNGRAWNTTPWMPGMGTLTPEAIAAIEAQP